MIALDRIRAILLGIALVATALAGPAAAQNSSYIRLSASEAGESRPIYLGINKSAIVELPRAAGDVLVSNPQIADAVLRTSTRLYLIGVKLGQANVFLFDQGGRQMASFDVYVEADLGALNQLLAEAIPNGYVRADALNESIILRGQVSSSADASRAVELTESMMEARAGSITNNTVDPAGGQVSSSTTNMRGGPGIINLLTITGEEQVALKVTIAEVQREVVKQLGINTEGLLQDGNLFVQSVNGLSPFNFPLSPAKGRSDVTLGFDDGETDVSATVRALEETRMLRTLAEPTLTAVSGETANFLAGGEFPIPVNSDDGDITIAFKQFGVNLAFTPVVLSAGRISLKIRTEVSELSTAGAITLASISIPGISTRRAETSVELPSGGAFVIAGLIQESTRRAASGFPLLQKLPVLGQLFSSKDYLENQTELVMIVTPYLVKPAAPQDLARPDQNLMMAGDAEAYFLNRLTKVYGAASPAAGAPAGRQVGFTFD